MKWPKHSTGMDIVGLQVDFAVNLRRIHWLPRVFRGGRCFAWLWFSVTFWPVLD
jgi:hypothetical protein